MFIRLCLLCLLTFGSCRPSWRRPVAGTVLSLEGRAQGTLHGKSVALTKGSPLPPGERITTSPGARLDLLLLPGVLVALAGETEIEIEQLRLSRDGDETIRPMTSREAKLRLQRGILSGVVGQAQERSTLVLHTPAGTLTAFDLRTFKIEVEQNRARVISVRGKAIFQPTSGGAPIKIGPGYFATWPANPVVPRAALSDPATQAEVTQLLSTEKRLFYLQKEYGSVFVPWRR